MMVVYNYLFIIIFFFFVFIEKCSQKPIFNVNRRSAHDWWIKDDLKALFISLVDILDVMIKDKKMTKTYEMFNS